MSALNDLLNAVIKESFSPEMEKLGKQAAEELAALKAERDVLRKILLDVLQGNYDNANDITYANRFIARELAKLGAALQEAGAK